MHHVVEQKRSLMPNYSNNTKRSWVAVDLGKGRRLMPTRYCIRYARKRTPLLSICFHQSNLVRSSDILIDICGHAHICATAYMSVSGQRSLTTPLRIIFPHFVYLHTFKFLTSYHLSLYPVDTVHPGVAMPFVTGS